MPHRATASGERDEGGGESEAPGGEYLPIGQGGFGEES
jgi:hypothetical protein